MHIKTYLIEATKRRISVWPYFELEISRILAEKVNIKATGFEGEEGKGKYFRSYTVFLCSKAAATNSFHFP
jgi:hypothetical protein